MYAPPPEPAAPPTAPGPHARRSNWSLRLLAALLSALAFAGFWLGAQHASPAPSSSNSSPYAPPSGGGLLPPGGLIPHGSTHVS